MRDNAALIQRLKALAGYTLTEEAKLTWREAILALEARSAQVAAVEELVAREYAGTSVAADIRKALAPKSEQVTAKFRLNQLVLWDGTICKVVEVIHLSDGDTTQRYTLADANDTRYVITESELATYVEPAPEAATRELPEGVSLIKDAFTLLCVSDPSGLADVPRWYALKLDWLRRYAIIAAARQVR